ncbi:MAG: RluA family pseudouridine synthase [Muribaculaceae bacterium]|nr:RluA family pseudouridine synthase [Muribaculaceae bacterium]
MRKERHHRAPVFKEDRILSFTNNGPEPERLLEFLGKVAPERSRTDLKSWLRHGQIMINGTITKAFDALIAPGEEVLVNTSRPFITLRHQRLQLVYEDDDIIVVNKGYGLLSVGIPNPAKKKIESAYDILRDYVKRKDPRNKIFVVHRLDRDTTGLMMFAKTEQAQETLRHNWNNFILERLYVAILEGIVEENSGVIKSRLTENSQYKVYSTENEDEGKLAVTRFRVLKRGRGLSMVEFNLDTGRKNQIRVHASELGHPISGDKKYGASKSRLGRLCLHAKTLRFAHPVTRKDLIFEAPLPSSFVKCFS